MGAHVRIEMAGLKFGEWLVLSPSHQNSSGNWYWNCQCSCGNLQAVDGSSLRTGKSNQCKSCTGRKNGRKGLYAQSLKDPVYFIKCGNYVKIGTSKDVVRRLRDLEASNPYPLEILYVDYDLYEEEWHVIFEHRKHRGEWFDFGRSV